jgi:hypothetical protein
MDEGSCDSVVLVYHMCGNLVFSVFPLLDEGTSLYIGFPVGERFQREQCSAGCILVWILPLPCVVGVNLSGLPYLIEYLRCNLQGALPGFHSLHGVVVMGTGSSIFFLKNEIYTYVSKFMIFEHVSQITYG